MRVFLYTPFYPPQSQAAAIRCYWLASTMKNAGHKVDVMSSIETHESTRLHFNPADNKKGFLRRLLFEVLAGIELFFEIFSTNYDLYILSSPPFITILIAHLACRIRGHKYLIDVRDIYPDVYFAQGLIKEESLLGKIIHKFTKKMYRKAVGVTSVTPGLVEKIKALEPLANVELLINGFDRDLFKPSKDKFDNFTVIFHGNMGKVQNLSTILKVAEKLQDQNIDFFFIGEGPQAELFQGPLPKNVKYLGAKNYSEIPQIISKAHVGFSARRDDDIGSDAFPVKVFEYLGVGIPVIMTPKAGVMSKLVHNGIFEFGNDEVEAIASKILDLKTSGETVELKEEMSRQAVSKKILKFLQP